MRRHTTLDVVKMYSTLTEEHWRSTLMKAIKSRNIDKLISWRYGMQAGLSDAIKSGIKDEKLEFWVIKRCRDLEKAAKIILKFKHPMPGDQIISKTNKGQRVDYAMDSIEAKRRRDKEFERFLMRSAF